jgi:hypothetical protein
VAVVRLETDPARAIIPVLSWDTEGGDRARMNLLRAPVELRVRRDGEWRPAADLPTKRDAIGKAGARYRLSGAPQGDIVWEILPEAGRLTMTLSGQGEPGRCREIQMRFPVDPRAASTTFLASHWVTDGSARLPLVVSAPDFGPMYVTCSSVPRQPSIQGGVVRARLEGQRFRPHDIVLEWPGLPNGVKYVLEFKPLCLPAPKGLRDVSLWPAARRGWFNTFQPTATQWESDGSYLSKFQNLLDLDATPGVLANHVTSNRVTSAMYLWSDAALLVPDAAPGVSFMAQVRRTVDWCLDERVLPDGRVIAYHGLANMLDANAAPLIAAWDYAESTGDKRWLSRRIEDLERIADVLVRRDIDADGMVELERSGNYGEMSGYNSAYDVYNSGHKDGYTNLLAYRAWRCLADLESQLGRHDRQARYTRQADRLKAVFAKTLYNPATGWLAWWKSADGQLHDYAFPAITSTAIEYGLVEPAQGREMLGRLWKKIDEVGFKRFDLGLPVSLVPVRRGDYSTDNPEAGGSHREDGSEGFGRYLNGGCVVSDTYHFLAAHYVVGEPEKADRILRAMLDRQHKGVWPNGGGFQNGIGGGAEFMTWDGKPCGYEGHLTYSWSFLQAVLLREPAFRDRLYRPLKSRPTP